MISVKDNNDCLYATLDQLDVWYANFMKDAEQYKEEYKYSVTPEGRIEYRDPYRYSYDVETYKDSLVFAI